MGLVRGWVRRRPWPWNACAYGALFGAGEAAQQGLRAALGSGLGAEGERRQRLDGARAGRAALLGLSFHGHFSYFWLRALERLLPGRDPRRVLAKVALDQTLAAPLATAAFYSGMSLLQGEEDIFADCRHKFWNTYKTGLMYWPFVQLSNFILVPPYLRTAYAGLCSFFWVTFLCFSQESGDGTVKSVFLLIRGEKSGAEERSPKK